MRQRAIKSTVLAVALTFSGCLWAEALPVVTSFSVLGDVAQQIGGERVNVTSLVGADQDAHAYQLSSGDVKKIAAAKLVLLNGLGLEFLDFFAHLIVLADEFQKCCLQILSIVEH